MRIWIVLAILLGGCSTTEPAPTQEPTDDVVAPDMIETPMPEIDLVVVQSILNETITVDFSLGTPGVVADRSPWVFGFPSSVGTQDLSTADDVVIEIRFESPVPGGAALHTVRFADATTTEVIASATASSGNHGSAKLDIEDLDEKVEFWVGGASSNGSPPVAVAGKAHIAVTAFYGGEAPDEFTAL